MTAGFTLKYRAYWGKLLAWAALACLILFAGTALINKLMAPGATRTTLLVVVFAAFMAAYAILGYKYYFPKV